jgi:CRP-like cAMP-binding protein
VLDYIDQLKHVLLKKHEHFQMQGDIAKYMGYVDSGKFRYYKIDKEGNERTLWFNKSFPFIGDYHFVLKEDKCRTLYPSNGGL